MARDIVSIGLTLLVVIVSFVICFIAVSKLLPVIAPVHGKDLGYPFAVAAITIILGLALSALALRVVSHSALRKPQ